MELRKIVVFTEDVLSEGGLRLASPTRRVAAGGVISKHLPANPPSTIFPSWLISR